MPPHLSYFKLADFERFIDPNNQRLVSLRKHIKQLDDASEKTLTPTTSTAIAKTSRRNSAQQVANPPLGKIASIDSPLESHILPLAENRPTAIEPTRIAPILPPPPPQPIQALPPPPQQAAAPIAQPKSVKQNDTYVVEFDFSPIKHDNNQLPIRENERVYVCQKCDDSGNREWWLVENGSHIRGYVPSAFIRPATT